VTILGPVETTIVTVEPDLARRPGLGVERITLPVSTSDDASRSDFTRNPARSNSSTASCSGWSITSGTVPLPGPDETERVTVDPSSAFWPAVGSCSSTVPRVASLRNWSTSTSKPAASSWSAAFSTSSPVTAGTVTWSVPKRLISRIARSPASTAARRPIRIQRRRRRRRSSASAAASASGSTTAANIAVSPGFAGSASAASRARENSSALEKRFAGSLASARSTTASRAGGTPGFSELGGAACSETCLSATATALSPSNGTRPVSIS
jgi:hypothetical protein